MGYFVPIDIRIATASDIDTLVRLNGQVQGLHAELYPSDFKATVEDAEFQAFLVSIMAKEETRVILAEVEGTPAGYAWFEIQNLPETPFKLAKRRIFLHHICVNSDRRRNGIASVLVKHIEAIATKIGAEEIALDTWSSNQAAQSFFRASGFEPFRIFMRKSPAAVSPPKSALE